MTDILSKDVLKNFGQRFNSSQRTCSRVIGEEETLGYVYKFQNLLSLQFKSLGSRSNRAVLSNSKGHVQVTPTQGFTASLNTQNTPWGYSCTVRAELY